MNDEKMMSIDEYEKYLKSLKSNDFKNYLTSTHLWEDLPSSHKRLLWNQLTSQHLYKLRGHHNISKILLKEKIITFEELVDKFNAADMTYYMNYTNPSLLKTLFNEGLVTNDNLRYFLLKGHEQYLLDKSYSLKTYILENFLIDVKIYEAFLEKQRSKNLKSKLNSETIFDYLRRYCTSEKIRKLIDDNEKLFKVYNFNLTEAERIEILGIVQNSEKAMNILKQIIDCELFNIYTFNTLKDTLTKDDKKKKQKLNF